MPTVANHQNGPGFALVDRMLLPAPMAQLRLASNVLTSAVVLFRIAQALKQVISGCASG